MVAVKTNTGTGYISHNACVKPWKNESVTNFVFGETRSKLEQEWDNWQDKCISDSDSVMAGDYWEQNFSCGDRRDKRVVALN